MLREQGLEQTHGNRAILYAALWYPWEVYICLLYAEIEYYNKVSRKNSQLVYEPLEKCLALHRRLFHSLRMPVTRSSTR